MNTRDVGTDIRNRRQDDNRALTRTYIQGRTNETIAGLRIVGCDDDDAVSKMTAMQ